MYIGIAKLAHEAMPLALKARVEYLDLATRALLNRCSGERMPFQWTINPYRGCEFGCVYCYARYTHEWMEYREPLDFERKIFAKSFQALNFAREVRKVKAGDWIAIGTATDPYQPAERRYGVTRSVLEWFAKRTGYRVAITTKSDLVARDAELLAEIAKKNDVRVNFTITTVEERLARLLEPMAPRPELRLKALERVSGVGIPTTVMMAPVLPGINDSRGQMAAVARAAQAAGAGKMMGQVLFLKDSAAAVFLPFVEREYPMLAEAYRRAYGRGAYVRGAVAEGILERVREVALEAGLTGFAPRTERAWGQQELFGEWAAAG